MSGLKLAETEGKFVALVWEREPISSGELVQLGEKELNWKKSTTYTVLRRLCERGLFQNADGTVTSLVSHEEYYAMQSEQFVEETFQGSLPGFLAAFTKRRKLSKGEIDALQDLIDKHRG